MEITSLIILHYKIIMDEWMDVKRWQGDGSCVSGTYGQVRWPTQ